jgi:rhodanese-related sulfurtransferase
MLNIYLLVLWIFRVWLKNCLCKFAILSKFNLNSNFTVELESKNFDKDQPLLFICRSGLCSKHAAISMTNVGVTKCYNIVDGFEGDKDDAVHRGCENGWKHAGLPWVQE